MGRVTARGCAWCPEVATGQTSNDVWACTEHLRVSEELDRRARESAHRLAEARAYCDQEDARDANRVTAYEDALRGIAAAAVIARRTPYDRGALQTMLTDVEHHLSSLIALGFVPTGPSRRRCP